MAPHGLATFFGFRRINIKISAMQPSNLRFIVIFMQSSR